MNSVNAEDPFSLVSRLLTKGRMCWMRLTYPFAGLGKDVSIHYSCELRRTVANRVRIGDSVYIAPGSWLSVPEIVAGALPAITLGNGCKIGRRCTISAKNRICLEDDVMIAPSVLIMDHAHEFSDVSAPIHAQGLTAGGTIRIERNCWLGHGAAVICNSGELILGRNSVVGANAVVNRSVPPFSVVVGSPAKVVRQYEPTTGKWVKVNA